MLAALAAFLAKIGIGSIASKIADAYLAKQNAATEQERIAADERIKALEARRDVMIAEAGSPLNALIRLAFALPFVVYIGKLVLWDKVLGLGSTDPLSPMLENVMWTVVGFFFLHWTVGAIRR